MHRKKPSRTAYKVAMNILALDCVPEMADVLPAGIVDATAQLLITSGAAREKTVRWARSRKMVRIYEAFDWMMPGQFRAFARRKAFCERQVRNGIAAGVAQVLVLGAGYDTLGWRLAPEFPQVDFFEIDHPATAALKATGIAEMGSRSNLHLVAEDLGRHKLVDVLAADKHWNPGASTVVVAEGLLQYLAPEAVRDLFIQCAAISGECRIAFTHTPCAADGRPNAGPWTGLVLWLLKVGGEPWLWSINPEDLEQFLGEVGWRPLQDDSTVVLQGVEFYAIAEKSS